MLIHFFVSVPHNDYLDEAMPDDEGIPGMPDDVGIPDFPEEDIPASEFHRKAGRNRHRTPNGSCRLLHNAHKLTVRINALTSSLMGGPGGTLCASFIQFSAFLECVLIFIYFSQDFRNLDVFRQNLDTF